MQFGFLYDESLALFSFQGDILFDTQLPEGDCDKLSIHQSGNSTFFSVLNSTEKQVYLFSKEGQLISGFPVFGTSIPSIGDINLDGYSNLITTGKEGHVYAYSIQED